MLVCKGCSSLLATGFLQNGHGIRNLSHYEALKTLAGICPHVAFRQEATVANEFKTSIDHVGHSELFMPRETGGPYTYYLISNESNEPP
jgi:hypothetical protein